MKYSCLCQWLASCQVNEVSMLRALGLLVAVALHPDLMQCTACRYIYAARELGYASMTLQQEGLELEANRNWQYVYNNGKDSIFNVSDWHPEKQRQSHQDVVCWQHRQQLDSGLIVFAHTKGITFLAAAQDKGRCVLWLMTLLACHISQSMPCGDGVCANGRATGTHSNVKV